MIFMAEFGCLCFGDLHLPGSPFLKSTLPYFHLSLNQASIEMPGIKGLWSLRASGSSLFDQYLVQSYIGETRVLSIDGEEMGEVRAIIFTAPPALCSR